MMRKRAAIAAVIAAVTVLTACSAGYESAPSAPASSRGAAMDDMAVNDIAMEGGAYAPAAPDAGEAWDQEALPGEESLSAVSGERKIITTVYLHMETTEYDSCVQAIYDAMNRTGGHVEYSDLSGRTSYRERNPGREEPPFQERYLYLRLRIPQERLEGFLGQAEEAGNLLSRQENAEDVTLTYVDMQSRISSLRAQQDRLLEMLAQVDTVEDMLALEEHLAEVRYRLESYESQMNVLRDQVTYATVHINLNEVMAYTEREGELAPGATVPQRITFGLQRTFSSLGVFLVDLFVWLVVHFIYLALLGAAVVAAVAAHRRYRRKKAGAQAVPPAPPQTQVREEGEKEAE